MYSRPSEKVRMPTFLLIVSTSSPWRTGGESPRRKLQPYFFSSGAEKFQPFFRHYRGFPQRFLNPFLFNVHVVSVGVQLDVVCPNRFNQRPPVSQGVIHIGFIAIDALEAQGDAAVLVL